MKRIISCFLAVASFFCLFLSLSSASDPEVERIRKAYKDIKDMKGGFLQKSTIKDLGRTDTFKGTFVMKMPSKMRWEYRGGDKQNTEVVINDNEIIVYQKKEKQAFRSRFDRETYGQAPIALLGGFGDIERDFEIERKEGRLLLKPKRPMGNILSIELTLSESDFPIRSLTLVDRRSNRIEITLKDVSLNTGVTEGAFDFSLPKGSSMFDY